MVTVDGGEPERVTEDFEPHSCDWSPDGSRLAYVSGNPNYVFSGDILGNRASSVIRVLSLADSTTTTLSDELGVFQSPLWLPSGDGILYVSNVGGSRDIYVVPVDASGRAAGPAMRVTTGADALTIAGPPRGAAWHPPQSRFVTGDLYGPLVLPQVLHVVGAVRGRVTVPVVGSGGVSNLDDARALLEAGCAAVQIGAAIWRDPQILCHIARSLAA